jgi:glycosyltransferase involved in cell wall biosynthesis
MLPAELPWRLDVYGDGPWRRRIEQAIAETATSDRVTLHGRVPIDELPRLLAAADIGLVPSLKEPYLEYSLSTKLLELAAMGVPTIASDLATFRDHFTDAALRYVDGAEPAALARAVEALVADPAAAEAMGQEARRQARPYGWDVQRDRYLAVVDALIASRDARRAGA